MDFDLNFTRAVRTRIGKNRAPAQGTNRPERTYRSPGANSVVKLVRGKDHYHYDVVDWATDRVIYPDLDMGLAQKLVPLTNKIWTLFHLMDEAFQQLQDYYKVSDRDAEATLYGQPIKDYIAGTHRRLRVLEARVEVHDRQLQKVWDSNSP